MTFWTFRIINSSANTSCSSNKLFIYLISWPFPHFLRPLQKASIFVKRTSHRLVTVMKHHHKAVVVIDGEWKIGVIYQWKKGKLIGNLAEKKIFLTGN